MNSITTEIWSLFIITAFILTSFNLNHRPNHLKMHFLKTNILLWLWLIFVLVFSRISLSIFRWWYNSWCNKYSRKSASSNNCYRGGVFTCWQNVWLINARVWHCNHFICWTICNKHRIEIKFLLYPFYKKIIQLYFWESRQVTFYKDDIFYDVPHDIIFFRIIKQKHSFVTKKFVKAT